MTTFYKSLGNRQLQFFKIIIFAIDVVYKVWVLLIIIVLKVGEWSKLLRLKPEMLFRPERPTYTSPGQSDKE